VLAGFRRWGRFEIARGDRRSVVTDARVFEWTVEEDSARLDLGIVAKLVGPECRLDAADLGVCLGMQLLFERSTEQGGAEGLGRRAG